MERVWNSSAFVLVALFSIFPAVAQGGKNAQSTAAPPQAPFTDYRYEKPGTIHKITAKDLPAPYATNSASNWAQSCGPPKERLAASTGRFQSRIVRYWP